MKKFYTLLILMFLMTTIAIGQRKITGRVISETDNRGLPGVTVLVKNDNSTGTITDMDGNFSLDVPNETNTLVFSFIGMETQEVNIEGKTKLSIVLKEETEMLEDVIVTAIGIKVEKKSIGFAAQEVKGDDIGNAQETNFVNALSSKVAGVEVVSSAGTPGASSSITIRGRTSLRASGNSPLFVVDGIPMDNSYSGSSYTDYSNRAIDLNSDDIESVTVLKGASAAALYGIRAANGAIIITTKSGKGKQGLRKNITVKQSVAFDVVSKLPEKQMIYAQGSNGLYADDVNTSWGPLIDTLRYDGSSNYPLNSNGRMVGMSDPSATDQQVVPFDNTKDFFRTGIKYNTHLSMSGGNEMGNYYFSTGHLNQKGIIPNSNFKRTTVKISGNTKLTDNLRISGSANYSNSGGQRLQKGSNLSAVMVGLMRVTPTFDIANGSDDPVNDESAYAFPDGTQRNFYSMYDNPYWSINKNIATNEVNRLLGNTQIDYKILPWLSSMYRVGLDFYTEKRKSQMDNFSSDRDNGFVDVSTYNFKSVNSDFLLTAEKDINDDLKLTVIGGHNYYTKSTYSLGILGDSLSISNFIDVSNTAVLTGDDGEGHYKIVGAFYDVKLAYKGYLYFNTTGRNDWSSTLPKESNSFFYPSFNIGFIFSDAFNFESLPFFNYGKIRASYAEVGNDADPYSLRNYLSAIDGGINGQIAYATKRTIGNMFLEPETTTSSEVGLDLRFFKNRLGLDLAVYQSKSIGQIVEVPIAYSSGYTTMIQNAGVLTNTGIEAQLFATPVKTTSFSWDIMFNFSKNKNMVDELPEGVPLLEFENSGLSSTRSVAIEGEPYGVLYGSRYLRNDNGDILVGEDGYPLVDQIAGVVGDPNPDFMLGIRNTLSYKGLRVTALIDIKQGGDIHNGTKGVMTSLGTHKNTENRNEDFTFEGINVNTNQPNTVPIKRDRTFYSKQGGLAGLSEAFIEDGSYIRLRELGVSYQMPGKLLENLPLKTLSIGFTGRNLLLFTNYSGIDPETNLSGVSNSIGRDYFNMPNTKSFEFNIQLSF